MFAEGLVASQMLAHRKVLREEEGDGVGESGWKGLVSASWLIRSRGAIGTLLSIGDSVVSRIDVLPAFLELTIQWTIGRTLGFPRNFFFSDLLLIIIDKKYYISFRSSLY